MSRAMVRGVTMVVRMPMREHSPDVAGGG